MEGPRAPGVSQGVGGGFGAEGREQDVCGPGSGEPGGRERAVSRLWVCAPTRVQVTFTPVLFFKMEGSLGLDLNCSAGAPGRVGDPVLFGKPMLPSFPLCVITVGSSLCFAQILLPPSGVEEEETHLTN